MLFEEVAFNDVQHLFHLAEDKTPVLRKCPTGRFFRFDEFTLPGIYRSTSAQPDTTIVEELSGATIVS